MLREDMISPTHGVHSWKRPKVYATRNFPERFNEVLPSSRTFKVKGQKTTSLNRLLKLQPPRSSVKFVDGRDDAVEGSNEGPKCNLNADEAKRKVKEILNLFWEVYDELSREDKDSKRLDMLAMDRLKKKRNWICPMKRFGHIPGIEIGDQFRYRAELAVVGLHCPYVSGIDYVVINEEEFATSIVDAGQYENRAESVDVLIYSGQGGHKAYDGGKTDQKLVRGNRAMVNSMKKGNPVRVIKKNGSAMNDMGGPSYVYDGLYIIREYWRERNSHNKLVFKFELIRESSQERPSQAKYGEFRKMSSKERCVVVDVSGGKEKTPIRAMNGVDSERPQSFGYITNIKFPDWYKPFSPRSGCNCIHGCSNSNQCVCVVKNGGEISFTEKGGILVGKDILYECGPSCKCPTSCMNRVSQHGPRYKLELNKAESGQEWGVRSPSYISSGSFVCEFVGALRELRNGERVCGFSVDATKLGNVGRFISNSSRSSNVVAQRILYDHEDKGVPHIMLFAAKNIRPLQGLSCDFNSHGMIQISEFQYQLHM